MFVITGGGTGIGRALALALAERQRFVLIIGRREAALKSAADSSSYIDYFPADVSTQQGREKILTYLQAVPKLAGLIHNAGMITPMIPLREIDEASWHQVMATNLDAPLFLTQGLFDKLNDGRILHIGSGAAYFPVKAWGAYGVSKAALSLLTRCWQLEYPQMAFASVMPGIIDTDMQSFIREALHMDPEKRNFFIKLKENQQLITVETVALFLSWLLLDVDKEEYRLKEWDIYDTTHHAHWLTKPHIVPSWE